MPSGLKQNCLHSPPEICFYQSNSYRVQFRNYPVYLSFLCNVTIFMNLWQIQACSVIALRVANDLICKMKLCILCFALWSYIVWPDEELLGGEESRVTTYC